MRDLVWWLMCLSAIGFAVGRASGRAGDPPGTDEKWLDLTHAVVVVDSSAGAVERKAAQMLIEEAAKRSGVTLKTVAVPPKPGVPVIFLGSVDRAANSARRLPPEGFLVDVESPAALVRGNDARGCIFGVGYLLRKMRITPGKIEAPVMRLETAPAKPVRGHQLGFRVQSNTYDRWGVKEYEQYIRDLAVWGTNAIELIPYFPDTDPKVSEDLTVQLADVIHSYGMEVWLWFPYNDLVPAGLSGDGLEPGTTACATRADGHRFLLERRRRLFSRMKYLDAVFAPGGDPGGCECDLCKPWETTFLKLSGETAKILQETHPDARMWLSNQMFSVEENRDFHAFLVREQPKWLAGLVYSPWAGETCKAAREHLPARYALRMYPDITHSLRCQFTIPDWDQAFASTLDREPPVYRPTQTAHLARFYQPLTCGSISYSDGVNDDLNKALWSAYLWDPKADLRSLLVDYGRYYMGAEIADRVADGIMAIEADSSGPLAENVKVERTYSLWHDLERDASPDLQKNWRFQMALLRSIFDLYVQRKLRADQATETRVYESLKPRTRESIDAALAMLRDDAGRKVEPELRAKLLALGQALLDSIGMQLSVPLFGASGEERGAILDHLDTPLANQAWLKAELERVAALPDDSAIRAGIERIVEWENPGPGGFYDDLGDPRRQPHLVRGKRWEEDPGSMESPRCDFHITYKAGRQTWNHYAETLYDTPLVLRYEGLDPNARYSIRTTYSGRFSPTMTLTANDRYVVHGPVPTLNPPTQREWPIPREATSGGTLTLTWRRVTGRGCQVAEVWLIKHPAASAR